jgi:hypothetical protein
MSAPVRRTDRESLTPAQRFGEFVTMMVTCLVFGFFAYHQQANTGFFSGAFGGQEMFLFYGPMLLSLTAPATRAVVGLRNPARPLEVATNLFMALAAIWLLTAFPFDFTHLADALPSGLQVLLAWVNNDIGRLILLLQAIICPVVALVTAIDYVTYRGRAPGDSFHFFTGW